MPSDVIAFCAFFSLYLAQTWRDTAGTAVALPRFDMIDPQTACSRGVIVPILHDHLVWTEACGVVRVCDPAGVREALRRPEMQLSVVVRKRECVSAKREQAWKEA